MGNLNNITVVGNITREGELRYTPSGIAVLGFGLAINRSYKNSKDEWVQEVSFVEVTVWNKQAENCAESLNKGDRVVVSGDLRVDYWEKDGEKKQVTKITANIVSPSLEYATCTVAKNVKEEIQKESANEEVDFADEDVPF